MTYEIEEAEDGIRVTERREETLTLETMREYIAHNHISMKQVCDDEELDYSRVWYTLYKASRPTPSHMIDIARVLLQHGWRPGWEKQEIEVV